MVLFAIAKCITATIICVCDNLVYLYVITCQIGYCLAKDIRQAVTITFTCMVCHGSCNQVMSIVNCYLRKVVEPTDLPRLKRYACIRVSSTVMCLIAQVTTADRITLLICRLWNPVVRLNTFLLSVCLVIALLIKLSHILSGI